ncbi:tRNA (adenosine(37)-N6)-dimethylallyltransferase MiaA [Vulcanibacillus modesticaldus]|uniref:tRNA dimethylallyltransferase n=1 Tax=Vulcanibacillus modesticaldus TaxID=337097 RepID=A0A1D2YWN6_9BACI|nr:tRNA (adenosine(37)-N6)-dimethylallyltransferase MiaA [Vulcanibacillus modesticaldus]OEG00175.1 tRNA (adenosine(37)-N6)-dimethylallyltransferase MiaA [Vulcanibacillus modesticaldus]
MKEKLLVIVGPTAVGKTELSIDLALRFKGEIISGDSMQVYKGLNIGTAKIKPEEMRGVPHHLIDCYSPDHNFSVAEFQELATKKISEINSKGKLPIIVGGTGLYIKSVTHQYQFSTADKDEEYREKLIKFAKTHGNEVLHKKLAEIDPKTASKLHINDLKRVIRALEVYHATGKTFSQLLEEQKLETPYDLLMVGLTMDRTKLYDRINRRVDNMIEEGLIEEVKKLLELGYDERYNSMQGIGYKEIIKYLRGEITLEQAIHLIKQGTRRFAKRQLSWFRQMPEIHWFDMTDEQPEVKEKNLHNIYELIAGKFQFMKN